MRYWTLALLTTLAAAYYQRATGPTHPLRGTVTLAQEKIAYRLERSHGGASDQRVSLSVPDTTVTATLYWRRYPTSAPLQAVPMQRTGGTLAADLPHQPPAGKLEYRLELRKGDIVVPIPAAGTVITRFKGEVPAVVLVPHVLMMFLGMAWANRAGIEALRPHGDVRPFVLTTTLLLIGGGMILGPVVQKYAFGAFWTGFPFGHDLTDNKTLVVTVAWLSVLGAARRNPNPRTAVLIAAVLTLLVYLIPHSLLGSELKYE